MKRNVGRWLAAVVGVPMMLTGAGHGWGHDGHSMIDRLAVQKLPVALPEFLRGAAAQQAMSFYGPEPDRWLSRAEPELKDVGEGDHYLNVEQSDLLGATLPRKRYDYVRALIFAQKDHPEMTLTPEAVGTQPYAATEWYQRLKASMRDYRGLVAAHQDTKAMEAQILFCAGILGHFVGDVSNPLHTTDKYNGWVGPNPENYTTLHKIHAQMESEFVAANVNADRDIAPLIPAEPKLLGDFFDDYMVYLHQSNKLVERCYQLEKAGGFVGAGSAESRGFIDQRLAVGATELRDVIYTAWVRSADPVPAYKDSQKVTAPAS